MPSKKPHHVQRPPIYVFLGVQMAIHLSGAQTGGEFSIIGAIMPPGGDGGLHVHTREDESVHLLTGELEVTIGEEMFLLRPGESYFAPRNIPHRLRNTGNVAAHALLINTPGTFDEFVRKAGVPASSDGSRPGLPDAEQIHKLFALAAEFGVRILAPPEPSSN
jgi:mannose-6-phosphate isomerase-like protein (cupin superfamily)